MFTRRMTVIVGRFGSGKTEVAVNGALEVARRGERVTLVDLDVVKPYFQSRSLSANIATRGVHVVAPDGHLGFAETPAVPLDLRGLFVRDDSKVIVDVGGDPVGTLVCGSALANLRRADVEHLVVLNFARPQTESVAQAVAMARAIEAAARRPIDGIIANTHLLADTTPEAVMEGLRLAQQAGSVLGVPMALVAVEERLMGAFPTGWATCPILPIRRMVFPPFELFEGQPYAEGRLNMEQGVRQRAALRGAAYRRRAGQGA